MPFALWKIDQPNNNTHIFLALPNVGLGFRNAPRVRLPAGKKTHEHMGRIVRKSSHSGAVAIGER